MIISIDEIKQEDDLVFVRAVVEDAVQTYSQTYYEPAEYGPALCEASFELDEDGELPKNEEDLLDYLNSLNLSWEVLPKDWDY
jgi:hypothetical protein